MYFLVLFYLIFINLLTFFYYDRSLDHMFYTTTFCVGAGVSILMLFSEGLDPFFFCRKMKKTAFMREETDGNVFISSHSWPSPF